MRCIMGNVEVAYRPFLSCPSLFFKARLSANPLIFFLLTQITLVFALSFVLKVSFWKLGNGILRPLGLKHLNKKRTTKGLLAFVVN